MREYTAIIRYQHYDGIRIGYWFWGLRKPRVGTIVEKHYRIIGYVEKRVVMP